MVACDDEDDEDDVIQSVGRHVRVAHTQTHTQLPRPHRLISAFISYFCFYCFSADVYSHGCTRCPEARALR